MSFLNNFKMAHKIIGLVALCLILLSSVMGGSSLLFTNQLEILETVYHRKMVPLDRLRHMQILFRELEHRMISFVADIDVNTSRDELTQILKKLDQHWMAIRPRLEQEHFNAVVRGFEQGYSRFQKLAIGFQKAYADEDKASITDSLNQWHEHKLLIFKNLDWLTEVQQTDAEAFYDEQKALFDRWRCYLFYTALFLLSLFLFLAWRVSRAIVQPLTVIQSTIQQVEETGDCSVRVPIDSMDEMGQTARSFNHLLNTFQKAIREANDTMLAMEQGDFSKQIQQPMKGNLGTLKKRINQTITRLGEMQVKHETPQ